MCKGTATSSVVAKCLHADTGPADALCLLLCLIVVFCQFVDSVREFCPRSGEPAIAPLYLEHLLSVGGELS